MSKKRPRCDICGEHDHKIRKLAVYIDGQKHAGWRLCRPCMAVVIVGLTPSVRS